MDVKNRTPATGSALRLAAPTVAAGVAAALALAGPAMSETLESALAKAYGGNPQLNASRALTRVRDEDVAIAQSGYRPTA